MTDVDAPLTAAQKRVLDAALELFSTQGVAGTSLSMIAEHIGVTKAAVYHQYNSKEDIVVGVADIILKSLEETTELALKEPTVSKRRQVIVENLIDQALRNRKLANFLQSDPYILNLFKEHPKFTGFLKSVDELLLGNNDTEEAKVITAIVLTSIGGAVRHPLVEDVDTDTLRDHLYSTLKSLIKRLDKK